MNEVEIKGQLQALRQAIADGDGATISSALTALDRAVSEQPRAIEPKLLHYLQKRSYEKAWAFLGGESDIPEGICGGKS